VAAVSFAAAPGERTAEIYVDSQERVLGESKYDFRRLVNLAIDGVLSLIPTARFAAVLILMVVGATVLVLSGVWPVALLVAVGLFWLVG